MVLLWLLLEPAGLRAQVSFQIAPGMAGQFQVPQPPVEVIQAATAAVSFDPPVVRAGETAFYRVTIAAAESAIQWPDPIDAPPELKLGAAAHGQSAQVFGTQYRPATTFLQEIRATAAGHYTISNFTVSVNRQQLLIPAERPERKTFHLAGREHLSGVTVAATDLGVYSRLREVAHV